MEPNHPLLSLGLPQSCTPAWRLARQHATLALPHARVASAPFSLLDRLGGLAQQPSLVLTRDLLGFSLGWFRPLGRAKEFGFGLLAEPRGRFRPVGRAELC